jgi:two-component system, chemotaxis family, protein-glutamate methylesterase/glutaminase
MKKRDIIVIGSSAGGVHALQELVAALPADFGASIFVVQHVAARFPSILPHILTQRGPLIATHPVDNEEIRPGRIYVAPPDLHMLIEDHRLLVKKGPKENRFRPSIDALFRSAAYSHGPRVIGIVLTGLLDDGTSGMWSVKRLGGIGIVQQPEEARYAAMPQSVLEYVEVDYIRPLSAIAALLVELVNEPISAPEPLPPPEQKRLKVEVETAAQKNVLEKGILHIGEHSTLTCPECNGTLVKIKEGNIERYRCHTGHSFLTPTLLGGIYESVENNLWKALQNLEEIIILCEQQVSTSERNGDQAAAADFRAKADEARRRTQELRKLIVE